MHATIRQRRPGDVHGRIRGARVVALCLLAVAVASCSAGNPFRRGAPITEPISLVAILPIERVPDAGTDRVAREAERVITAHAYAVLVESPRWRVVPDGTVDGALRRIAPSSPQATRARALGKAVGADAVLIGTVARYIEREGTAYGSDSPAAVALRLALVSSRTGEVLWQGEFNETQQALSTNLLNFWQFWRAGPRWFTVAEYSRLGVERLLEDLERRAR